MNHEECMSINWEHEGFAISHHGDDCETVMYSRKHMPVNITADNYDDAVEQWTTFCEDNAEDVDGKTMVQVLCGGEAFLRLLFNGGDIGDAYINGIGRKHVLYSG